MPAGGEGPGAPPPKGLKIKPRFEFVIVFTWKEPTPSDKLRVIKKKEEAPVGGAGVGGGKAGVGSPPPTSAPPPKSGGDEGGGDLRRGFGKDD
jgi:hypothetical protein